MVPKNIDGFKVGDVFGGNGFDAVFFHKKKIPEVNITDFSFLRLENKEIIDHNVHLGMDRWLVILFERTLISNIEPDILVYYQAVIGDPVQFAKNQVKAGCEGFMAKSCLAGYTMTFKIIEPAFSINPGLEDSLNEDYMKFCKKIGYKV